GPLEKAQRKTNLIIKVKSTQKHNRIVQDYEREYNHMNDGELVSNDFNNNLNNDQDDSHNSKNKDNVSTSSERSSGSEMWLYFDKRQWHNQTIMAALR
ncbi:16372_t:CDS:2, partial [Dentiscutata heterogama]